MAEVLWVGGGGGDTCLPICARKELLSNYDILFTDRWMDAICNKLACVLISSLGELDIKGRKQSSRYFCRFLSSCRNSSKAETSRYIAVCGFFL